MHCDLLVLGGGVIGLACARAIHDRHPGLRVAILDADTGALPASRAAAGMLAPFAEFAEDSPLARFCTESLARYRGGWLDRLTKESGVAVECLWNGTLVPAFLGEDARFDAKCRDIAERGLAHRILEGPALRAAEPALAPAIERALWLPEGVLNPRQLHDALREAGRRRGFVFLEDRATEVIADGARVAGLRLAGGGEVGCERLLAATGAWGEAVARLLDVRFPVGPVKGQVGRIAAPDGLLRHIIHLKALYLAPRPGQGVVLGATEEPGAGFDTTVAPRVMADFHADAARLVPALADCPLAEAWAGFRPRTPDAAPLLGPIARWSNVLVATGHFRNGILLTPLTGEVLAGLYDGEAAWEEFAAERFVGVGGRS
ncbi:MAG: FAD-dependent oxidoreductase [Sumerlaeia bacterium]